MSCALLLGVLHAEDGAEQKVPTDQTAQIPKGSGVLVRLPSLDRLDELAKRFKGVAELAGGPQVGVVIDAGVSNFAIAQMGIDPAGFDRKAPILLAMPDDDDEPYVLLRAAKENGIAGEKDLPTGQKLVVKDGIVHVGTAAQIAAERRGKPVQLLKGDVAVQLFLGEMMERHKEEFEAGINEGKKEMAQGLAMAGIPMEIALEPMFDAVKGIAYGIDTIDYAFTVKEQVVETEGLIKTKAESGLRKFLARAGAPAENSLSDYLPEEAFMTVDMAVTPDWPGLEMMEFLKRTAGDEMGEAISQMMSMSKPIWGALSGRSATSVTMQGMMGFNMHMIYELKEGTDTAKLFDKFEVEKLNEGMKKLNFPVAYKIEKNVGKHGETALHKMSLTSDDPNMQMALMMSTYYLAAEGNHLYMVMSMNAELEIKDLIDRVRKGAPKAGAHSKAMDRLGRKRNLGITMNFGALKPVLMMLAMADASGQANQYLNAMPDELLMSTALSVHEGDVHWKGDIPLAKILKMIEDIKALQGEDGGDQPGAGSEFD
ncbi:MAG: hypothetical protein ACYTHK_05110 [Planctomycetota bacterium]